MRDNTYQDRSKKYCCPSCRGDDELSYRHVPVSKLTYESIEDGFPVSCTEALPDMREYKCGNCEQLWFMTIE